MDSRNCGYCESCAFGRYSECERSFVIPPTDPGITKEDLISAIEACHHSIFSQCFSNPIRNSWGQDVNMSVFNEMYLLAFTARKELDDE